MTKVLVHLWLVGILGLASDAPAECERMYRYSWSGELSADDMLRIHVPDARTTWGTIYSGYDVHWRVEFCGSDSEYLCFIPGFAVPKPFDGSVRKWTVGDTSFEVVREDVSVQVLGRRIDGLYAIKASPSEQTGTAERPREFLYSPSSGLISITIGTVVRWLMDDVGFGASDPGPASYPSSYRSWNLCPTSRSGE